MPARWTWSAGTGRASTTAVVKGINLLTLLWTDGDRHIPCDYRLYDKAHDGFSKNDLFGQLLRAAKERGLQPEVRLLRQLVQQSGQPQADPLAGLDLADAG